MSFRRALPVLVLVLPLSVHAQEGPCATGAGLRRTVPVNVIDRQGNQVRGLTAANFRAEFRGQWVKILSATWDSGPRRIVILLDISDSMNGPPGKKQLAVAGVQHLVRWAAPGSSLTLLIFDEKVEGELDLVPGDQSVAEQVARVLVEHHVDPRKSGRTALLDTIVQGLALLDPPHLGDVVYAITDGGDNRSRTKRRAVENAAQAAGVRIFAFFVPTPPFERVDPEVIGAPSLVRELTQSSGGNALTIDSTDALYDFKEKDRVVLSQDARRLYRQMAEFYRVEVELPGELKEPQGWKLEVVDAANKRQKDLAVIYPRKLLPCAEKVP